jgi:hypothetical protein
MPDGLKVWGQSNTTLCLSVARYFNLLDNDTEAEFIFKEFESADFLFLFNLLDEESSTSSMIYLLSITSIHFFNTNGVPSA